MTKIPILLVLIISLVSCGKDGSSSSATEKSVTGDLSIWASDKVFTIDGETHAPMDIISQELTITFNPTTQKAIGLTLMKFKLKDGGRPYFELIATPKNIRLDSTSVDATSITDPDGQKQSYWSLDQELKPIGVHEVEFEYELPSGRVSFVSGGARFLTDMTDLSGKFFEYWGPCGFEGDTFKMNMELKLENSTSTHKLYTNGKVTSSGSNSWKISFPAYFSKSSFYVHLTNQTGLTYKKFVYKGLEKEIPVEVYGVTSSLVNSAVTELPKLFKELEGDYGPYPHEKFVAYLNDRKGGMEYVGATITSLASIDHELLHSWFARSVIPADGRSGWIDEAMASWRDYGYTRAKSTLTRTPTNLANYSPFRKTTPSNSYVDGRALMAELDFEFASLGGMKKIMRAFFDKYKNSVVNNEMFWQFLEDYTHANVGAFELRYAMGKMSNNEIEQEEGEWETAFSPMKFSKHPDPLTREEILRLR